MASSRFIELGKAWYVRIGALPDSAIRRESARSGFVRALALPPVRPFEHPQ